MTLQRKLNTDVGTGTRGTTSGTGCSRTGTGANRPAPGRRPAVGTERGTAMGAVQRHTSTEPDGGGRR